MYMSMKMQLGGSIMCTSLDLKIPTMKVIRFNGSHTSGSITYGKYLHALVEKTVSDIMKSSEGISIFTGH
jgi:hypothetical protein